ncbi:MAG TPA: bifunctional precorrin-2 dehydrogenase/sirohydrochlorin ferrochelatase [Acidimicrobiales bacterium]
MTPSYPVMLDLDGRSVLVVGAGPVAARKIRGVIEAGATVTVVAPEISAEVRRLAATHDLVLHERSYDPGDVAAPDVRLVITATGVPHVDAAVFADAEVAGVWINSADDPEHCSFTLPAVARRDGITVAVATAGASPALSTWLRDLLAGALPDEVERLVPLLVEVRGDIRDRGVGTEHLDWPSLIDELVTLLRDGRHAEASERASAFAAAAGSAVTGATSVEGATDASGPSSATMVS